MEGKGGGERANASLSLSLSLGRCFHPSLPLSGFILGEEGHVCPGGQLLGGCFTSWIQSSSLAENQQPSQGSKR